MQDEKIHVTLVTNFYSNNIAPEYMRFFSLKFTQDSLMKSIQTLHILLATQLKNP